MANSVNEATIIGRVGRDPEVRTTQVGKMVNLSVATSERWKNKAGEPQERTEWHRITVYNDRIADVAEKYVHKGDLLHVKGQIETRKYTDQSGTEKYTTEIVLRPFRGELNILHSASKGEDESSGGGQTRGNYTRTAPQGGGRAATQGPGDLEDEIPFSACWQ